MDAAVVLDVPAPASEPTPELTDEDRAVLLELRQLTQTGQLADEGRAILRDLAETASQKPGRKGGGVTGGT
ncbi:MAG: hypothetical protein HN341_10615 [Verrucomicrobia bacterium]|nr:hypothetical protein [Verrucomicrobiota bacterium]